MNNSTYFDSGANVHRSCAEHDLSLSLDSNTISHAFQQSFRYHHLSPATHQRQDSMFRTSPLVTSQPLDAQHQVSLQHCTIGQTDQHSHKDYPQPPVNNGMSRSRSHYSSTSSGQHSCYHSPRRASHGSFGSGPASRALEMSRSYSSTSATQHAALRPGTSQQRMYPQGSDDRLPSDHSPNTGYEHTVSSTMNPFHFDVNYFLGGGENRNDNVGESFVQAAYFDE